MRMTIILILTQKKESLVDTSVADPHHCDADPDPAFHFDADPDPEPGSGSYCQLGMVKKKFCNTGTRYCRQAF